MEKIPTEILNCIFIKLHQIQKVECMLVCRRWYDTIKACCLLDTIVMSSQSTPTISLSTRFSSLSNLIRNNNASSLCTTRLVLANRFCVQVDMMELSTLFPNLRSLYLNQTIFLSQMVLEKQDEEAIVPVVKFLEQLECFHDYSGSLYFPALLRAYHFNHLTSLSVSGPIQEEGFLSNSIGWLNFLSHAPVLNSLELQNFILVVDEFEVLYENAPLLMTLKLNDVEFEWKENFNSILPKQPNIETLSITRSNGTTSTQILWAEYFLEKHTNLIDFTFEAEDPEEFPKDTATNIIKKLGDQVKFFHINFSIEAYDVYMELEQKIISLNGLTYSIQNESQSFSQIQPFSTSILAKNLHTLELHLVSSEGLTGLKDLVNLKHLALGFRKIYNAQNYGYTRNTIQLDFILTEHCPHQLESLVIREADVKAAIDQNRIFKYIKSLKLEDCVVHGCTREFLSKECPNLCCISFFRTKPLFYYMVLPFHNIDLLQFDLIYNNYSIITNEGGTVRFYSSRYSHPALEYTNEKDRVLYSGLKRVTNMENEGDSCFFFKCQSIGTLIINGCIAI